MVQRIEKGKLPLVFIKRIVSIIRMSLLKFVAKFNNVQVTKYIIKLMWSLTLPQNAVVSSMMTINSHNMKRKLLQLKLNVNLYLLNGS